MSKKYEFTGETKTMQDGNTLHRIIACKTFGNVKSGELGGWIENKNNLSHEGNAWVYGNARVSGNAEISGDADYATIKGFGTKFRTTTFFKCSDGSIKVNCCCFYGTLKEFRKQVNKTRSGKIRKEYLMIADLMKKHFSNKT